MSWPYVSKKLNMQDIDEEKQCKNKNVHFLLKYVKDV